MPATAGQTPVSPDSRRPAASTIADPPGIAAWRRFLEAHARVTRRLDDELQAAHGLSLAEYDALLQIADDTRAADPDERPRGAGPPVAQRDHPARRPPRGPGLRGADRLRDGRTRPGGAPDQRRPRPTAARPPRPISTASADPSSTGSSRRSSLPSSPPSARSRRRWARTRGPSTRDARPPRPDRAVAPAGGVTVTAGRLRTGTSGFAYPAWSPRFYPAGLRSADLLRHYASRLGDGRAEQHLLPDPVGRRDRRLARPRPRTTSGSRSRPRRAAPGGRSGWIRPRASRG